MNVSYADLTPKQQETFSTIAKINLQQAGKRAANPDGYQVMLLWKNFNKRTIKSLLKYGLISFPGEAVFLTQSGIDLALSIGMDDHIVAFNEVNTNRDRSAARSLFKQQWHVNMMTCINKAVADANFKSVNVKVSLNDKYGSMSETWEVLVEIKAKVQLSENSHRPFGLFEVIINNKEQYIKTCSGDHEGLDAAIFAKAAMSAASLVNNITLVNDLRIVAEKFTYEAREAFIKSMT